MKKYRTPSNAICVSLRQLRQGRSAERGVALVITLLFLALLTVLSLGMIIALSSQTLIGGFYRNYRASFYAADSGLNIARDLAEAQLTAGVPPTFPAAFPTLTTAACAPTSDVTAGTTYANTSSLNTGTAAQSWNEKFQITNLTVNLQGTPVTTGANSYSCTYSYAITAIGSAQGSEQQTVTETGNILMSVSGAAATNNVSFAYFGAFVDDYPPGLGPLVPGTMTGPMFTNKAWEFMANQPPWTSPYVFTDPIGQVMSQVDYWDTGWGQHWVAGPSYGSGANLIAPDFEAGIFLNQTAVPEPSNAFNQEEAVIDGNGTLWPQSETPAQATAALAVLQNPAGQNYSGGQGVYMSKGATAAACGSVAPPCMAGGGFYVEGNANVELYPSGATAQVYVITQGSTTTTITVTPPVTTGPNPNPGSTVISTGTTTQTLNGVPMNTINPSTPQAQTMVYVDGTMTFQGPGEGQGAVQDNAMITLTANGDAIATGDVLYKTEPVTIPQDALVPGALNMNQVLGIYTATGNFITADTQADQNIEVDGSIATISQADINNNCSGQGGQLSYGHINTFNNVGGMEQSCIYAADVNTENTWFDRRFTARPNFAPPWFPSTQITTGGALPSNPTPHVQRLQWLSTSSD